DGVVAEGVVEDGGVVDPAERADVVVGDIAEGAGDRGGAVHGDGGGDMGEGQTRGAVMRAFGDGAGEAGGLAFGDEGGDLGGFGRVGPVIDVEEGAHQVAMLGRAMVALARVLHHE